MRGWVGGVCRWAEGVLRILNVASYFVIFTMRAKIFEDISSLGEIVCVKGANKSTVCTLKTVQCP